VTQVCIYGGQWGVIGVGYCVVLNGNLEIQAPKRDFKV